MRQMSKQGEMVSNLIFSKLPQSHIPPNYQNKFSKLKILDDSKKLLSSYSIGHPEELNTFAHTENLTTTTGDVQTTNNIETIIDTKTTNEIKPKNIDVSVNPKSINIDKRIDLSNPKLPNL